MDARLAHTGDGRVEGGRSLLIMTRVQRAADQQVRKPDVVEAKPRPR